MLPSARCGQNTAASHTKETVELFDQALNQLIDYVGNSGARAVDQLAPIAAAPLCVVQRLARHDEIAVSQSLFQVEAVNYATDLVDIANSKSQAQIGRDWQAIGA